MSLLSRAMGKVDAVVGDLPPDVRDKTIKALRTIFATSSALGEELAQILSVVDDKTKARASRAFESVVIALAIQVVKGNGLDSLGDKLAVAASDAPHMRRALTALADAQIVDAEIVDDGKAG